MKAVSNFSINSFKSAVASKTDAQTTKKQASQPSLVAFLNRIWQTLGETNLEPKIRQHSDRAGKLTWEAYDPITGRVGFFTSEDEVYEWLEQRYYQ